MLANLTKIVKAQYAAKLGKNVDDLQDIPLEDMDFSDLESRSVRPDYYFKSYEPSGSSVPPLYDE